MKKVSKNVNKLFILLIVFILISVAMIIIFTMKKKNNATKDNEMKNYEISNSFVQEQNVDTRLADNKTFDNIDATGVILTQTTSGKIILVTMQNNTDTVQGGYKVILTILDNQGTEINSFNSYVKILTPGESTQLLIPGDFDTLKGYDYIIKKE